MRTTFATLPTLAAALIAAEAAAQPEPPLRTLPETVVTATRVPTPTERIPAGVSSSGGEKIGTTVPARGFRPARCHANK